MVRSENGTMSRNTMSMSFGILSFTYTTCDQASYPGRPGVRESKNNRKICKEFFFSFADCFPYRFNFPLPLLTAPGLPRLADIFSSSIYSL